MSSPAVTGQLPVTVLSVPYESFDPSSLEETQPTDRGDRYSDDPSSQVGTPAVPFLPALLSSLLFTGCKGKETAKKKPVEEDYVIADEVVVFDEQDESDLLSASEDLSTLTFSADAAVAASLVSGSILASAPLTLAPYGMLREVQMVEDQGSQVLVTTTPAALSQAILKGTISVETTLLPEDVIEEEGYPPGPPPPPADPDYGFNYELPQDFVLYDADGEESTTDDQITVNGTIKFDSGFGYDLELDYGLDWPPVWVEMFRFGVWNDYYLEANLHADAIGEIEPHREKISDFVFDPITVWIGPVPVVIVPELSVYIMVEAALEGELDLSASGGVKADAYIIYEDESGWDTVLKAGVGYDQPEVCLDGNASLQVGVVLDGALLLYNLAGVGADASAYLRGEAEGQECGIDYEIWGGYDLTFGWAVSSTLSETDEDDPIFEGDGLEIASDEELLIEGTFTSCDSGSDSDGDNIGDECDNCPNDSNNDQADTDGDGMGDVCDDSDGDGIYDDADNCLNDSNADQADSDGDGIGDVCDDSCAPSDRSLSAADAQFTGEAEGDWAGWSVAGAGDVNRDGYDDILVGAPSNGDGNTGAGAAYLVLGKSSPGSLSLSAADAQYTGAVVNEGAGWSVAGAGDVNKDGYDDILIGAPEYDDGTKTAGVAYLVLGGPSPGSFSLSAADIKYTGEETEDYAGWSVAGAGDVNNDGYNDILIGAPGGGPYSADYLGTAYLILGDGSPGSIGLSAADAKYRGEATWDDAGSSVAGAGDVNGDSYDDLLVSAPDNVDWGFYGGAAYLVLGDPSPGSLDLSDADAKYTGEMYDDSASFPLAGAGDVNNDGYGDFLIGAHDENLSDFASAAHLVLGDGSPGSIGLSAADAKYTGEATGDYAGWSVAGAGDVNKDSHDDFLIGALGNMDGGASAGAAYLVLGEPSPGSLNLSDADAQYTGEAANDYAGSSVAGTGDVDNDGYNDLLVGAVWNGDGGGLAGAAYLILGCP